MAIQGFFTGDVKIRDLNGVLKAVDGIVEVATDAGTVTSVGLTVGSTGTDVNVANSPVTTSGNITLNLPTASATNRGLLSSADWTTFNSKQGTITLTTTGSSGAATLIGTTLNIPNYSGALTGYVPYTGATGNVDLGEYGLDTGFLNFDTTPTGTPTTQGTVYWDDSRSTLSLIMNGVTQHIGQDSFFYVKNSTGSSIPKGTSVMFNGTDGASGHLLIAPFLADGTYPSSYFMGVTAETIGNGGFGQVVNFGELEGINTSAYTAGDLLYASSTVAGGFQTTAPSAPNNIVLIAAAVNSKNNGAIVVRPTYGSNINDDEGVLITSAANNQGLFYDSATGLWKNKSIATVLGYTPANAATTLTINGTTYDISANRTWSVGTVTSVGTSGPLTGGTITGSGTIGITQSSAASDGYLSNTDWVTFNNKQTALNGTGFVKISGTTISYDNSTYYLASNPSAFIALTALSATSPLSYDNTTGVFSISQATTSTNGYLSSTDWNTFNNKQAAGSYITALTGEATATGPGSASVTLSTSAVTGKILTGLNLTGGGTIADTDSILQAFGKVQNQISGLAGGVTYQGVWNASTNTPTLTSSVGTKGYYYIVDVAGSTNLNGITDWKVGDWVIFNGSTWDKVDNTDAVSSVNGFTGAVSLTTSNIAEGTNLYYLDSRARLALSFTAGSGAYDNTTGVITIPTNTSQLTNGANYITLSSLSASSPLSYNSGTGAFSIQVANGSQNGYLSSTDWTTFNSKQPAGNYVTIDTVQTITALKTFTSKVTLNTGGTDDQLQIVGTAPSVRLTNAVTGATINGFIAMSGANDNYIQGSVSGDMTIGNQNNGKILFGFGSGTATQKMSLDSSGNAVLSGGLTLGSTLSNGTYTYTLPGATGTLALTSSLSSYVPYTGATGAVNLGPYDLTVNSVIVGKGAGTGSNNVVLGDNSLSANTTGSRNVAIGTFPLWKNTTGTGNIAIGAEALINELSGNNNIAIGDNTAKYITTGSSNTIIGPTSDLSGLTTGSYNTIFGGALNSLGNISNNIILADGQGNIKYRWDGTNNYLYGNTVFSSTISNGTYTYTLPGATGTLALTSAIPANPVGGTGTTNYLPKFTGTSTIGNSGITDDNTTVTYGAGSGLKQIYINGGGYDLILGASGGGVFGFTSTNISLVFSTTAKPLGIGTNAAQPLIFGTSAAERMRLDASGNLMVGSANAGNAGTINVSVGAAGTTAGGLQLWAASNQTHFIQFGDGTTGAQVYAGYMAYAHSTDSLLFGTNGADKMFLNSSGNLGLGVSPSAWASGYTALQIENTGLMADADRIWVYANGYFDGSANRYIQNGFASRYYQANSSHVWETAPSGTAGNAISFTQAMTLNASGNLSIGNTNDTYKLDVSGASRILASTYTSGAILYLRDAAATGSNTTFGGLFLGSSPGTDFVLGKQSTNTVGSFAIKTGGGTTLFTLADTGAATFSSSVTAGGSINATTSVNGASVNTLGTQSTFRITSNYAGSGDIPAGTLMYLDDNTYTNLGIIPSSSGTAGSKIAAVAFNGSAWRSMWEFANVSSGNPNLLLVKNGGNVGIGTSSPTSIFHVNTSSQLRARLYSSGGASFLDIENGGNSFYVGVDNSTGSDFGNSAYARTLYGTGAYPMIFYTNSTERLRISSGGSLLVGTTSELQSATSKLNIAGDFYNANGVSLKTTNGGSGSQFVGFINESGTLIGSINRVTTTNAVAYNTTSDYRLKEDLKSINGLEIVNKIKVYDYKWKSDNSRMDGVLAHELAEVLPYAVTGIKDGEKMQQVDYSKIVPVLIQSVKELKAELDTLKNK